MGDQNPRLRPAEEFTQAMKDRLAMRLLMRPDRRDLGEPLPMTQVAWDLPLDTPEQAAHRVSELVKALATERLIVPITVEADPDDPDHRPLDPNKSPLKVESSPYGDSVVAFTSAGELADWDPAGRPMTMKSFRVAVGAAAATDSGTITLNPASPRSVLIPRPAVLALSVGDPWLPAWENAELTSQLRAQAVDACPAVVGLRLRPASGAEGGWDGGVAVDVYVDSQRLPVGDPSDGKACLAAALGAVGRNPMLKEAAQRVELVPRPVAGA